MTKSLLRKHEAAGKICGLSGRLGSNFFLMSFKVFNAIAIQDFELASPCVLVTLSYAPAAYHDRLEIISAGLILV